ncbi:hypothetical protein KSZ_38180 [Dictyobacter formicarum]|uniref:Uncharacterized protein n=1 Tax=Dictyobacter formicarum TaxID=2778368 RepID=A0ABQ3VI12_9CHLR|nr:hypothetical protein KSZ_38180 [Dictyobacter formicarum]
MRIGAGFMPEIPIFTITETNQVEYIITCRCLNDTSNTYG